MATVRVLTPGEAPAALGPLRALTLRAKASWGYDEDFLEAFATSLPTSLHRPGRVTLVAEVDDVVAGFAIVDDHGDVGWLEDLWVEPAHQRRGVGRQLLDAAATTTRRLGHTRLEWESDPHAEPFYLAQGAHRVALRASSLERGRLIPVMRLELERA